MKEMINGVVRTMTAEEQQAFEAAAEPTPRQRIAELKELLAASDYKTLKFVEGVLTEEQYLESCTQREAWREEINMLEQSPAEE